LTCAALTSSTSTAIKGSEAANSVNPFLPGSSERAPFLRELAIFDAVGLFFAIDKIDRVFMVHLSLTMNLSHYVQICYVVPELCFS
jgi:hypothetical protein